jgi:thioredoxin reductase (NADPH)
VVVIGSNHCAGTLRVKEFLDRNVHPFTYIDLDRDADVQSLLDRFQLSPADVPVVIGRGTIVMRNPGNHEIAANLGFNEIIDATSVRDVVIVGAGPAGLAAAVYAASEGLSVLMIETQAPGGQSGSSSKIENYLGFPTGISGRALSARAYAQAQKFGAKIVVAESAIRLECARKPYAIVLDSGTRVPAHTIVIASGAEYRKPPLEKLAQFEGMGVYYAATHMEAQLCTDEEVIVVGGGNSAGQAAVFLAQSAKHVHVLVRSKGLAESMSRYLIHRIEQHPRITLWTHTEIVALDGDSHLRQVQWKNNQTGEVELRPFSHVFLMTGADPCTRWLDGCLALDNKGFIKTGTELSAHELSADRWAPGRPPLLLETSLPGVFAVGDVRAGNIKRVASAVGEGSISISLVHQVLNRG